MVQRTLLSLSTLALVMLATASVLAFAGDSQKLNLHNSVTLNGVELKAGQYKVSWDTHTPEVAGPTNVSLRSDLPDVTVTFTKGNNVIVTAHGKLVYRDANYNRDAILYRANPDGSTTITELRFRNMDHVIMLDQ